MNIELSFRHQQAEKKADEANGAILEANEKEEEDENVEAEVAEAKMTPEELEALGERRSMEGWLKMAKTSSILGSRLRQAVALKLDCEVTVEDMEKSWDRVKDEFFKRLGEASLLRKEYREWGQGVVVRPLLTPKPVEKVVEEEKKEEGKEKKKDDKKKDDGKKDDKKKQEEKKKEEEAREAETARLSLEAPKTMGYLEAFELVKVMEDRLNVGMEHLKAVNILDCFGEILDKHRADFEATRTNSLISPPDSHRAKGDSNDIDFFLEDIFEQISMGGVGTKVKRKTGLRLVPKTKEDEKEEDVQTVLEKYRDRDVYSVHDFIGLNKRGNGLFGKVPLEMLESATFGEVAVPGVGRLGMPAIPALSEQTRKSRIGLMGAFYDFEEPELERRLLMQEFQEGLRREFPGKGWDFLDRVDTRDLEFNREFRPGNFQTKVREFKDE